MRVYRGIETGSEQSLALDKLRFTQKWLHLPKNTARKENTSTYKIGLFNDGNIRWLYKQRFQQKLQ